LEAQRHHGDGRFTRWLLRNFAGTFKIDYVVQYQQAKIGTHDKPRP